MGKRLKKKELQALEITFSSHINMYKARKRCEYFAIVVMLVGLGTFFYESDALPYARIIGGISIIAGALGILLCEGVIDNYKLVGFFISLSFIGRSAATLTKIAYGTFIFPNNVVGVLTWLGVFLMFQAAWQLLFVPFFRESKRLKEVKATAEVAANKVFKLWAPTASISVIDPPEIEEAKAQMKE